MIDQEPNSTELAFLSELEKYADRWVAIKNYGSEDEAVVAAGESISEARKNAESQGFRNVTFFRVPRTDKLFVPLTPMYKRA
jgi:hypothetical protein